MNEFKLKEEETIKKKEYQNISVHFTLKGQSLEDIKTALDFCIKTEGLENARLHDTFLDRKTVEERGLSTELVEYLENLTKTGRECWYSEDIASARKDLSLHMHDSNGLQIFVGNITDGVKEELELAEANRNDYTILFVNPETLAKIRQEGL